MNVKQSKINKCAKIVSCAHNRKNQSLYWVWPRWLKKYHITVTCSQMSYNSNQKQTCQVFKFNEDGSMFQRQTCYGIKMYVRDDQCQFVMAKTI